MSLRTAGMLALVLAAALATALLPRIPQPQSYHAFADGRAWLGITNAADVASNLAFLLAGLVGLAICRRRSFPERPLYSVFFAGACLVSAGSAYYHLAPDDARLVWDRLPMTLGFMSLVAAVIAERVDPRWGRRLLVPLALLGAASVLYWRWSELRGAGDLRPYAMVQFMSLVVVVYVLLAFRRRPGDAWFWSGLGCYALAKVYEHYDAAIFAATARLLSGHTLKHLAAAAGFLCVAAMLARHRAGGGASSSSDQATAAPARSGTSSPPASG